ncbi:Putative Holin-X, holin superfamily III [Nitrosomonas sp. Nm51]|uniref:phage holin family protein n=1 Tax=Nitrosomonas sp. Nm51 TaxID=133720 RepID=UPI0008C0C5AD|nr:phage holin family protein [Nitrosomonas sp. Nm51]SEQ74647.1 Putative Holin-X, holin superfamily III [Nitrosomonas sp. Nm51]
MHTGKEDRTLSTLLNDLARQTSDLIRQETKLAIAEMSERKSETKRSLTALATGAGLLVVGLIYILDAVVYGLAELLPSDYSPWLAALIVGILTSVIGYMFITMSKSNLAPENLAPRTADSLQRDKNMVEEKLNG